MGALSARVARLETTVAAHGKKLQRHDSFLNSLVNHVRSAAGLKPVRDAVGGSQKAAHVLKGTGATRKGPKAGRSAKRRAKRRGRRRAMAKAA